MIRHQAVPCNQLHCPSLTESASQRLIAFCRVGFVAREVEHLEWVALRIVTWNCRVGGFQYKASRVAELHPDVLVVQEVENLDSALLFGGHEQPTSGIASLTRVSQNAGPRCSLIPDYKFRTWTKKAAHSDLIAMRSEPCQRHFNLAAVWTWETKVGADSYRQVHKGLNEHAEWVRQRDTVGGSPGNRQRLQRVLFPEGLRLEGRRFGTAVTCLAFNQLRDNPAMESDLASPRGPLPYRHRIYDGMPRGLIDGNHATKP
jgi:hypothetical protein